MAKNIVVANWKMEPDTLREALSLFRVTKKLAEQYKKVAIVVSPPSVYLGIFSTRETGRLALGGQDIFWEKAGAYTGEINARMFSHLGIMYAIIGHSERRAMGESDEIVSKKIKASLSERITPILCVGERERDTHGNYLGVLKNQLKNSLAKIRRQDVRNIVIAYEPVWAIGRTARGAITPRNLHEMVIFLRKVLADIYGRDTAHAVRIIYGGSVEESNAESLIKEGMISGFLVGHASLEPRKFKIILEASSR
jgi:triosephosphate isomerase